MRLIDADELKAKVEAKVEHRVNENDYEFGGNQALDYVADILIDEAPTIDAVQVVRCKDCKHYEFADNRAFGLPVKYCDWFGFEDVDDDDFCSRGERRDP